MLLAIIQTKNYLAGVTFVHINHITCTYNNLCKRRNKNNKNISKTSTHNPFHAPFFNSLLIPLNGCCSFRSLASKDIYGNLVYEWRIFSKVGRRYGFMPVNKEKKIVWFISVLYKIY